MVDRETPEREKGLGYKEVFSCVVIKTTRPLCREVHHLQGVHFLRLLVLGDPYQAKLACTDDSTQIEVLELDLVGCHVQSVQVASLCPLHADGPIPMLQKLSYGAAKALVCSLAREDKHLQENFVS